MANHYSVGDPKAEQLIDELLEFCVEPATQGLFREMLTTLVKLAREHRDQGDYKLINTTLKELRHAFRVFLDYRDVRKVMIFGSARMSEDHPAYIMAQDLACQLADQGMMIISGAGGGIMEAANRGAGRERSFGINIRLPFEQKANAYIDGDPKLMEFKYFFTRKLMFIKESQATVLFPGGFGTLDEGFENLTLFQTGKCLPQPILMIEPEGGTYWKHWMDYVETELLGGGYISDIDLHMFKIVNSNQEALKAITDYYRAYHSLRYVGDETVLRLVKPISPEIVEQLNKDYTDILRGGQFRSSQPLPAELDGIEPPYLPRLVFSFDKKRFGRLNQMIEWLNQVL